MLKLPNRPRLNHSQLKERILEASESDSLVVNGSENWDDVPVGLFAIRGYFLNSMGKRGKNDRGIYDDAIFVATQDGDFTAFNANVDPSSGKRGRANLLANQVVWYRPGKHGLSRKDGGYPAFRQASTCIVKRDGGVGNGKALGNGLFTDVRPHKRFWINLHRGDYNTTSSAGCQTIPPQQWNAFRDLVNMLLKRYDQKTFPYLLLPPAK